jgi:flagella basal body P-ring formation protein FlgA
MIRAIVVILISLLTAPALAQATRVSLKSSVRLADDTPVTLADIADIEGPQSEEIGSISLDRITTTPGAPGWVVASATDIRSALEQDGRIHSGTVVIVGVESSIKRMLASGEPTTPTPTAPATATPVRDGPIVRDHIERWLSDRFETPIDSIRYEIREHDSAFLGSSTLHKLVEIREVSRRGRVALRVIVYDGEYISAERGLTIDVSVQREVLVATERVTRGDVLRESAFTRQARWVSPDTSPADPETSIGMSASRTINPGQIVDTQDIEIPLVVQRGDIVSARSIAGSVVVTVRGRARADARRGDLVELESIEGNTRFIVRAVAPGRGVIVKDATLQNTKPRHPLGDRS